MATDDPPGQGNRGRRRPGPTIELEATEIASAPVEGQQAEAASATSETPQPGTATADQASPPRAIAWLPPGLPWRLIGAGAAGALLALMLFLLGGLFTTRDPGTGPLELRIARVEQQVRDLANRPPPPTIDPKAIDDLASRLTKIETTVATQRPLTGDQTLLNRLASLEGEIKALDEKIGLVARRTDDNNTIARDARQRADANAAAIAELARKVAALGPGGVERREVEALATRISGLEQSLKTIQTELAKRGTGDAADRTARLAVTSAALNAAVERGDAFASELAAAKALAGDATVLTPLDAFAESGVPSAALVSRELLALMPALTQLAGGTPREAGFLDRLQVNAEKLVRIRPLDGAAGDDAAAMLARVELKATQADIAGTLAELAQLSEPLRAPARTWIAKAEARLAAVAVSRRFAADAFASLGKAP